MTSIESSSYLTNSQTRNTFPVVYINPFAKWIKPGCMKTSEGQENIHSGSYHRRVTMPKTCPQTHSTAAPCSNELWELNFLLLIFRMQGGGNKCLREQGSELEGLIQLFSHLNNNKKKCSLRLPAKKESNLADRLLVSSFTREIYILLTTITQSRQHTAHSRGCLCSS